MSYILQSPSHEQKEVIRNLKKYNVVCDSVAGSGKTTTILHIAKIFKIKTILLLTYNAKLKFETRERVNDLKFTNIEIHSYHSFCVKYYDRKTFNDNKIKQILDENKKCLSDFKYDMIIIDEVQDMTPLYYELVCKIFYDNNNDNPRICITGDKYQSIYDFNYADERFIILANQLFNFNQRNWKELKLSTSFRLTKENADFINNCIINENRILTIKSNGFKPRYIICNTFIKSKENVYTKHKYFYSNSEDLTTYNEVLYYLDLGYKPEDIFILAPSVKGSSSPIRELSNKITILRKDIDVFIPVGDDEKIDADLLKNKLIFSSFHQSKGLERKVVIVFGIDSSYFEYFKQNYVDTICPNEIYVALTRSLERLTIFHNSSSGYAPFINVDNIPIYTEFISNTVGSKKARNSVRKININCLTKFVPEEIISKCMKYIKIENVDIEQFNKSIKCDNIDNNYIDIPVKVKENNTYENVEVITNIAITEYYNFIKTKKIKILDNIIELILKENNSFYKKNNNLMSNFRIFGILDFINDFNEKIKNNVKLELYDFLKLSTIWDGINSDLLFKIKQIKNYNWIKDDHMDECIKRLEWVNKDYKNSEMNKYVFINKVLLQDIISKNEDLINIEIPNSALVIQVIGYIDKISHEKNQTIKFVCKNNISEINYIQLVLLYHIYNIENKIKNYDKSKELTLLVFNILTNEMNKIIIDFKDIENIFNILICNKFIGMKQLTQNSFVQNNLNNYNKYFGLT